MATTRLTVTVDTAHAEDLSRRVKAAVTDALTAAGRAGLAVDSEPVTGLTASAVMAEVLRVSRANQSEAALARVRALHHDEYGLCAECTGSHGVPWPCSTINALNITRD